jgi:hypothetical protein
MVSSHVASEFQIRICLRDLKKMLFRTVRNRMLHARRQVNEIIRAHRIRLIPVVQNAFAFQYEITLLLAIVENGLAIAKGIQCNFPEPGNASQDSSLPVTLAEDWFVMASPGRQISSRLAQTRNVSMQPRGIDFPILSQELRRDQQRQQQSFQLGFPRAGSGSHTLAQWRGWYTTEYA